MFIIFVWVFWCGEYDIILIDVIFVIYRWKGGIIKGIKRILLDWYFFFNIL